MIKLVVEKKVKQGHRILCPHCQTIFDLMSEIRISQVPGGFTLAVDIFKEEKNLNYESGEDLNLEALET